MSATISQTQIGPIVPHEPMTVRDIIFGVLGSGMILFAVFLLIFGGPGDSGGKIPDTIPTLGMIAPVQGATVSGPLVVDFSSTRELEQGPGGWGVETLHIHLDINGQSFMPAPQDVVRSPNGLYRWTLPALSAGEHSLRLYWAGPDHREVADGSTEAIQVRVR